MGEVDALPAREIDRWARYWTEEPWGPYRDNLHAALIASELWKVNLPVEERSKVAAADFMFVHDEDRKQRAQRRLLATLTAISKKAKP